MTVALGIAGLATKSLTPLDALCLLIPVTLAVITAYATTSKHKDLILSSVNGVDEALHGSSPAVEKAFPRATPALAVATDIADVVKDAVDSPDATTAADPASFTQVVDPRPEVNGIPIDNNATQVLPTRAASILHAISNTGGHGPAPIMQRDAAPGFASASAEFADTH